MRPSLSRTLHMLTLNKNLLKFVLPPLVVIVATPLLFSSVFFYNEAGYMTHVRTIFGDEKVVDDVGYSTKWFGRATAWKKAVSVQSVLTIDKDDSNPENDALGATIEAFPIVFLGNVDAKVESSARFRLPGGDAFLTIAQEYRNPDNFIRTALLPAIKETLQATASLMTADDYYAGARSEFAAEFENQLNEGLYLIKRREIRGPRGDLPQQTAILQSGTEQGNFGNNTGSQYVTEKVTDSKNIPARTFPSASSNNSASLAWRSLRLVSPIPTLTLSTSSAWSRFSRHWLSWRWPGRTV
jgi:hypothetical protein